jgi:hypothetical protein
MARTAKTERTPLNRRKAPGREVQKLKEGRNLDRAGRRLFKSSERSISLSGLRPTVLSH